MSDPTPEFREGLKQDMTNAYRAAKHADRSGSGCVVWLLVAPVALAALDALRGLA